MAAFATGECLTDFLFFINLILYNSVRNQVFRVILYKILQGIPRGCMTE